MNLVKLSAFGFFLAVVLQSMSAWAVFGFDPLAPLNSNAAADSGDDETPQIASDGAGIWIAVWSSNDSLGGTIGLDSDILFSRSTDNGAQWTPPAALNTTAATVLAPDTLPQIATDKLGTWIAVWTSGDNLGNTIGGDEDILVSRSTNNGTTWTPPAALNANAASDSGFDFHPQIATDGNGNWVAVWESNDSLSGTIETDTDILVSHSNNNGTTWTTPIALNTNATSDSGINDEAPQIATDGVGAWLAVWHSQFNPSEFDQDVLVSRSTDYGESWTSPTAVNTSAATDPVSARDFYPHIATDGAGNWVVVWDFDDFGNPTYGTDGDLFFARSTDNGTTWTAPAPLNNNALTDSGNDVDARITNDGMGNWIVVWVSADTLDGTIGTDFDILISRSTNNSKERGPYQLKKVS